MSCATQSVDLGGPRLQQLDVSTEVGCDPRWPGHLPRQPNAVGQPSYHPGRRILRR